MLDSRDTQLLRAVEPGSLPGEGDSAGLTSLLSAYGTTPSVGVIAETSTGVTATAGTFWGVAVVGGGCNCGVLLVNECRRVCVIVFSTS